MHRYYSFLKTLSQKALRTGTLAIVVGSTFLGSAAVADIGTLGDVSPTIDQFGYPAGSDAGDLIVGDTDVGGLTMDVALQPDPLRSLTGIIGNEQLSIGRATFTGIPSNWLIGTSLIIGNEGQGFLDLFNSAKVQVGSTLEERNQDIISDDIGETILGDLETGQGVVTISGVASRLVTADLIVGDEGMGDIQVSTRGALITGEAVLGREIGSIGQVDVSDLGSLWNVGFVGEERSLVVGNLGRGTLKVRNQAVVQVSDDLIIGALGRVELNTQGRVRMLSTSANGIINNGVLSGDGYVDFTGKSFFNGPGGEIRNSGNATATDDNGIDYGTNRREKLNFTGNLLTNLGLIESNGGEMVFDTIVDNANNIVADDALLYFNDGLIGTAGTGDLILSGRTTVHGFISGNAITVLPGSVGSVVGGIQFSSPLVAAIGDGDVSSPLLTGPGISIAIGANPGSLTVIGDVNLAGGELDLDVSSLGTPTMGDIFEIITIPGASSNFGAFDNTSVIAGGYEWLIDYDEDSVFVVFDGLSATTPGDFDGDGDVDGRDFLAWQRNPSLGDLADWQANFPSPAPITGGLTAVPEPSTMVLLVSLVGGFAVRRRRS